MKSKKSLQLTVLTALFAAMTAALTFYVKFPTVGGYVHFGDAMIYLAASFLPMPFAATAGALGGALADFAGGYTQYIIPTFIIKALIALPFSNKNESKLLTKRNTVAAFAAGIITTVGYYLAEVVILSIAQSSSFAAFGEKFFNPAVWISACYTFLGSAVQAIGSAVLYIIFALALDRAKIKQKFGNMF